jgi:glycosyltransferase involved in cell wall biosynthesis
MRILQVLPHLSKGGAEKVVIELSNSLTNMGHEVTILLAYPVDSNLNQKQLGDKNIVQFVAPNGGNRYSHYVKLPFWVARNWKTLRNYDVIHCHLTFGLIFGSLVSMLRKLDRKKSPKLIATCHIVGGGVTAFPRILNELLSYYFDYFVLMAQDKNWRNFIANKNRSNILLITNGISAKAPKSKSRLGRANDKWKIGTISRLQAERRPWLFLETFAHIQNLLNQNVEFYLGGEGSEREFLATQSEKLGLNKSLTMSGLVQEPVDFLESLDLYITLNVEAITGIAGLEAVFAGVPVVGIQLSQNYENGSEDWIWSSQDPKAVAQEIVEYLKNPKLLTTIAEEQYKIASKMFSVDRMRDDYLALYAGKKQ